MNMDQYFLEAALKELRPYSCWYAFNGDATYENVYSIKDGVDVPSKEEVVNKIAELRTSHDEANAPYKLARASAYPSIADQLDQIYHEGIDAWKETIAAVKAEYPKP